MKDNKFNVTNPDIIVKIDQPLKISIANQDFRKHDFIVDDLNINTGYISSGQDFTTVIASNKSGSYRYYCSIHPGIMEGKIIVKSWKRIISVLLLTEKKLRSGKKLIV